MVRGCMLLAGHHPPHWCRCHHASCDMSCVGPGPGTQGERCCCLSIHCTSIMCHCVPDAAVLCHLTMHAGAKHLFIFNDFYKSKLPKTEGLKTIFHKIDCAQKKTPINRYFEFLIGRLDIVVRINAMQYSKQVRCETVLSTPSTSGDLQQQEEVVL